VAFLFVGSLDFLFSFEFNQNIVQLGMSISQIERENNNEEFYNRYGRGVDTGKTDYSRCWGIHPQIAGGKPQVLTSHE
jgi:hypothetical protein